MKKVLLILILFHCHCSSLLAQFDTIIPVKVHKAFIYVAGKDEPLSGAIYDIRYSSLMFAYSTRLHDYEQNQFEFTTLDARDIRTIVVTKANHRRIGGKVGFAVGMIGGLTAGFYQFFASHNAVDNIWLYGTLGSVAGGALGKLIGASIPVNIRISINGNLDNFEQQKKLMQQYSVKNNQ